MMKVARGPGATPAVSATSCSAQHGRRRGYGTLRPLRVCAIARSGFPRRREHGNSSMRPPHTPEGTPRDAVPPSGARRRRAPAVACLPARMSAAAPILLLALALMAGGCGGGEPGGDTATTTAAPVSTPTTSIGVPTTSAPTGPVSTDYITIERAGDCVGPGLCYELTAELQESIWGGARDWLYVATHCGAYLAPNEGALFAQTRAELLAFAQDGFDLDVEGAGFLSRLREEHQAFPGRTRVRQSRMRDFRERLLAHLAAAHEMRAQLDGQPGEGETWDSAKGWCEQGR